MKNYILILILLNIQLAFAKTPYAIKIQNPNAIVAEVDTPLFYNRIFLNMPGLSPSEIGTQYIQKIQCIDLGGYEQNEKKAWHYVNYVTKIKELNNLVQEIDRRQNILFIDQGSEEGLLEIGTKNEKNEPNNKVPSTKYKSFVLVNAEAEIKKYLVDYKKDEFKKKIVETCGLTYIYLMDDQDLKQLENHSNRLLALEGKIDSPTLHLTESMIDQLLRNDTFKSKINQWINEKNPNGNK